MKTQLHHRLFTLGAISLTSALAISGCSASPNVSDGKVTLNYAMWDDKQLPAYQACIDLFQEENPSITVKATQTSWDQYWTNLTTELSAGTAPDVFVNHVSRYPGLAANNQLIDLQPTIDTTKTDVTQYRPGLAENWVKDGKRYALPKDFDAIGLAYDAQKVSTAGISPTDLETLTWNPDNGGSFERLVATLTVDKNGKNGLEPGFDKDNVQTYGILAYEPGDGFGQTWWANFAASNGFTYTDKNPFGTDFHYGDDSLKETLAWFRSLVTKGYMIPPEKLGKLGAAQLLASGQIALNTAGSWQASTLVAANKDIKFAQLPTGPQGRKSIINGLGDSVFAGTKNPDQAQKFAIFLGSKKCQDIVATKAVVFPALASTDTAALKAFQTRAASPVDPSAFVKTADDKEATVLYPITDHATDVNKIAGDAVDAIMLGEKDAGPALDNAQEQIQNLFGK